MTEEPSKFEFSPPRQCCFRLRGRVGLSEITSLFRELEEAISAEPYFYLTIDLTQYKGDDPESRRYASDMFAKLPPRAVAIIADSFVQRTMAKLLLTAVSLIVEDWRQVTGYFKPGDPIEPWFEEVTPRLENPDKKKKKKK